MALGPKDLNVEEKFEKVVQLWEKKIDQELRLRQADKYGAIKVLVSNLHCRGERLPRLNPQIKAEILRRYKAAGWLFVGWQKPQICFASRPMVFKGSSWHPE